MKNSSFSKPATKSAVSALVLLLSGCSLIPEYSRPPAPLPASYTADDTNAMDAAPESWQQYFTDPVLQNLINIALEQNRDLRIAALRIEEARAQYDIQRSAKLPTIDATGSYDRSRLIFAKGETFDVDMYRVGIGISNFEIDFFGRIKSLSEAVLEDYLATREAQQTARTSLIAEVAAAYVDERALSERQLLAEKTLAAREASYTRIRRRFDAGIDTAIDLKVAKMQMESARASVSALDREHTRAINTLLLLMGDQSVTLPGGIAALDTLAFSPIPAGLPSDLLERRP
ncbi:MAG TPA: TolC family protein, partial [Nitrosomonas europaea]|nr:TolC family protein [Nitrosomonas europaea]